MTEIVLAVAECAFAVFPRLAPVNRREHDEPWGPVGTGRAAPPLRIDAAALLECVSIGGVVIDARCRNTGHRVADDVRFGGMKIAARGVDAQGPARSAELLPCRKTKRVAKDIAERRLRCARGGIQAVLRRAVKRSEGMGL